VEKQKIGTSPDESIVAEQEHPTHNEQLNKPSKFDLLWPQLIAMVVVVTEATMRAITPSKQSHRLRHSCNMTSYGGNLYLVNSMSSFRIMVQGIQCHRAMYGEWMVV
jgi:hypothetical protein